MYLIPRSLNKRKVFEIANSCAAAGRVYIRKDDKSEIKMSGNNWGRNYGNDWNKNIFDGVPNNRLLNMLDMPFFSNSLRMNPPPPPPEIVNCGELRGNQQGKYVEITGRFVKKRLGRFAELRDRHGATQLVICEDKNPRLSRRFQNMPPDSVLTVVGQVMLRPFNCRNNSMPTGDIEIEVEDIINIDRSTGRRGAEKRSYSTMAETKSLGITSTEYKISKNENILKYFDNRDLTCNDLRFDDVGKVVTLVGWLPSFASSKFQQLKDGYGQTQIIVEDPNMQQTVSCLPPNSVIQVKGKVVARPKSNVNTKYDTGEIELFVEDIKVLNPDDPYDGPIKEKVTKMSIEDEKETDGENGEAAVASVEKLNKVADTNKFTTRTHNCGELNSSNISEKVTICGWLEFQRMKKFLVMRDGYGQIQVLLNDEVNKTLPDETIPLESIVQVEGTVIPRPSNMINPQMKTGEIEIQAQTIKILNEAKKNLPMEVRGHNRAKEALRLEHRYIDLRFADMQRNLRTRSAVLMKMRDYLINYLGFVEVETPTLFRRTPGGAQEFVVPTRKPGHFYSLVQSPQQFKQMLMAGAIDRYFQIARCYRDEATRPDRQPEFTQLDVELSFTTRDDIMKLIEETIRYCWPKELGKIELPFTRITYDRAMAKYGSDKPDTRFELLLSDVTELLRTNEAISAGFSNFGAYALVVKKPAAFMAAAVKRELEKIGKEYPKCTLSIRKLNTCRSTWLEKLAELIGEEEARKVGDELNLEGDDVLILAYGPKVSTQTLLGRVRLEYASILEENQSIPRRKNQHKFLWVVDFPMFEENEETNKIESVHHPFTAPHEEDLEKLRAKENLTEIRSQAYDLVLDGQEVGGGSIRIHDRELQHFVLEDILQIEHTHLSHLLSALESGCPPHGGIALGIDRLIAIICQAKSIRDVIAFPKGQDGKDPLSKAPVPISDEEKQLYSIEIRQPDEVIREETE